MLGDFLAQRSIVTSAGAANVPATEIDSTIAAIRQAEHDQLQAIVNQVIDYSISVFDLFLTKFSLWLW